MTTQQRLLQATVLRVGRAQCAQRLDVPLAILDDWLQGTTQMPEAKFVLLVDDLLDRLDQLRQR